MIEQECGAYQAPDWKKMKRDEVLAHFAEYQFFDQEHHSLVLCADFISLVEAVCKEVL